MLSFFVVFSLFLSYHRKSFYLFLFWFWFVHVCKLPLLLPFHSHQIQKIIMYVYTVFFFSFLYLDQYFVGFFFFFGFGTDMHVWVYPIHILNMYHKYTNTITTAQCIYFSFIFFSVVHNSSYSPCIP